MFDSEFFQPDHGFNVYWRDRIGQKAGGVIILVKLYLSSVERSELFSTHCENLWIQLNLVGCKSVLAGAFYKPYEFDQHSQNELLRSFDIV